MTLELVCAGCFLLALQILFVAGLVWLANTNRHMIHGKEKLSNVQHKRKS